MRTILSTILLLYIFGVANAQSKTGLVLSGGGAKGFAHIGVLRALEENNIAIDYIIGSSTGAIVGAYYAAGYSPEEMDKMARSQDFLDWMTGKKLDKKISIYDQRLHTPSTFSLKISLDTSAQTKINTFLQKDEDINFVLCQQLAQASRVSQNNFDSLLVPFKCIASDIFTQRSVVLESGNLHEAVRASMSVPIFYKPVKIDNRFLFDGGVYDNFPVKVMEEKYDPDYIIGVNVSSINHDQYPEGKDEKLIRNPLYYLFINKSDCTLIQDAGTFIQPDLSKLSSLDFAKVGEIIDSGYYSTLRQIENIKSNNSNIHNSIKDRREQFNQKKKKLEFNKVKIVGVSPKREKYLISTLSLKRKSFYSIYDAENMYYDIAQDGTTDRLMPVMAPSSDSSQLYDYILKIKYNNLLNADVVWLITNRTVSYAYIAADYEFYSSFANHIYASSYIGRFYQSFQLLDYIQFPLGFKMVFTPQFTLNRWNLFKTTTFRLGGNPPTYIDQTDIKYGGSVSIPASAKDKLVVSADYIQNDYKYTNFDDVTLQDVPDISKLLGFKGKISYERNTLNRKQYPNDGHHISLSARWFDVMESHTPGSTFNDSVKFKETRQWYLVKLRLENYDKIGKVSIGYMFESVFGNQPNLNTYRSSVLAAPVFSPLQDSRTFLLENFRSFSYTAAGFNLSYSPFKNFDIRMSYFLFSPFDIINENLDQSVSVTKTNELYRSIASIATIYNTKFGPLGASFNYYEDEQYSTGLLLHFGYMLFRDQSID